MTVRVRALPDRAHPRTELVRVGPGRWAWSCTCGAGGFNAGRQGAHAARTRHRLDHRAAQTNTGAPS